MDIEKLRITPKKVSKYIASNREKNYKLSITIIIIGFFVSYILLGILKESHYLNYILTGVIILSILLAIYFQKKYNIFEDKTLK